MTSLLDKAIQTHIAGNVAAAQQLYETLLETSPNDPVALHFLGVSHIQQGRPLSGIPFIEQALRLKPDYADAHFNLGCAHQALNRHDAAIACYTRALAIDPGHAGAQLNLGNALQAFDWHEEAIARYQQALALRPEDADAHNNLGNSLQALNRHEEACIHYEQALRLKPDHAQARSNLGNSLQALNRPDEALAHHAAALAIAPQFAEAHNNLGYALQALNRSEEAIAHYEAAVGIRPDFAEAHNNWGIALQAMNRHGEAIERYDRAIALKPGYADAQWNKSLALLCLGRFAAGWQLYEMRWQRKQTAALALFDLPLWPGPKQSAGAAARQPGGGRLLCGSLASFVRSLRVPLGAGAAGEREGKNILIQFEQGLGDALQMLRYVPLLEGMGMRCCIQVPAALAALVQRSFPLARTAAPGECPPDAQYRIPMLSLPLAMRTFSEAEIPAAVPYLRVDEGRKAGWVSRLATRRGPLVGLAWRGKPTYRNDRNRSIPLEIMRLLLQHREIQFVALQKDLTDAESGELARHDNVLVLDRELTSFDETAAIVSVLDLVISVDTSLAHLAGALDKAVWVLLAFSPDWRWRLGRSDSPWYPSAKLFRQQATGDWAGCVAAVAAALRGEFPP